MSKAADLYGKKGDAANSHLGKGKESSGRDGSSSPREEKEHPIFLVKKKGE